MPKKKASAKQQDEKVQCVYKHLNLGQTEEEIARTCSITIAEVRDIVRKVECVRKEYEADREPREIKETCGIRSIKLVEKIINEYCK